MLRFRNVFYTISKLFHCPAKVFSEQIVHKFAILCCESYTCILILLCLSIFRSGAISGLGWMGCMGSLCGAIVWASLCDANNTCRKLSKNSTHDSFTFSLQSIMAPVLDMASYKLKMLKNHKRRKMPHDPILSRFKKFVQQKFTVNGNGNENGGK